MLRIASDTQRATPEVTEEDQRAYLSLISLDLSPSQRELIAVPDAVYPQQGSVLAIHWHPEFIPLDLIRQRIRTL